MHTIRFYLVNVYFIFVSTYPKCMYVWEREFVPFLFTLSVIISAFLLFHSFFLFLSLFFWLIRFMLSVWVAHKNIDFLLVSHAQTFYEIVVWHFSYSLSLLFTILFIPFENCKFVSLARSLSIAICTQIDIQMIETLNVGLFSSNYKINKFHLLHFRHNHKTAFYTLLSQLLRVKLHGFSANETILAMKPSRK